MQKTWAAALCVVGASLACGGVESDGTALESGPAQRGAALATAACSSFSGSLSGGYVGDPNAEVFYEIGTKAAGTKIVSTVDYTQQNPIGELQSDVPIYLQVKVKGKWVYVAEVHDPAWGIHKELDYVVPNKYRGMPFRLRLYLVYAGPATTYTLVSCDG